jgi:hypothetical protein
LNTWLSQEVAEVLVHFKEAVVEQVALEQLQVIQFQVAHLTQ